MRHPTTIHPVATAIGAVALTAAFSLPVAASGDFDADAYCAAVLALETAPDPDVDWEAASEEEIAEAMSAWAVEVLRPIADEVIATSPAELAEENVLLDAAVDELAAGNLDAFETEEMVAAHQRAHAVEVETCGWQVVNVELADYRFNDLPTELPAGVTSFDVTNVGAEEHEFVIFRVADQDVSPDDLAALLEQSMHLSEEEFLAETGELLTFVNYGFAAPGDIDFIVADLEPGRHLAVCFFPVGGWEADGAPHFTEGMIAEFMVTA